MGLLYFEGNWWVQSTPDMTETKLKQCLSDGNYIRQLQATFGEYSTLETAPPGILKFESQSTDDAESTLLSSAILSTFTRYVLRRPPILSVTTNSQLFPGS